MVGWFNWIFCTDGKGIVLCFCIYVDTVDDPKISLWSTDETGMEIIDPACIVEYGDNGSGDIVVD